MRDACVQAFLEHADAVENLYRTLSQACEHHPASVVFGAFATCLARFAASIQADAPVSRSEVLAAVNMIAEKLSALPAFADGAAADWVVPVDHGV